MASLHEHKMWGGRSQGDKPLFTVCGAISDCVALSSLELGTRKTNDVRDIANFYAALETEPVAA